MYMDVYWDRRLQTGEYLPRLLGEIESRDYFVLVMSPYSLREGGWCRKELEHAQKHRASGIALARIYADCGNSVLEKELEGKYTFGDFTQDFEIGFRRITAMILEQPLSSWEVLPFATDDVLLSCLKKGFVPGLIAKEIAEWVIVDKLWQPVENYAA
jgi:hypothetical protein